MGNEASKHSRSHQRRATGGRAPNIQISGPSGGLQMIPTPQRDGSGRPVVHRSFEINRDQLLLAFRYMAEYIRQRGANLTIYVAGGAVNTIYLRSRHTTGDVDFFGANEQSRILKDASKYAQQRSTAQIGANWFNNSMSLFLNRALEEDLMGASRRQNAILFSEPGLVVYAVPWRAYDAADAVAYLHQCVKANGERAINARWVEECARKYNKAVSVEVLMEIDKLYKSKYGGHGILF